MSVDAHNKSYEFWKRDSLAVHLFSKVVAYQKLDYTHYNPCTERANEIDGIVNIKIKVQAGMRWYVFKRDNWKCVACGRSAEDGIILHIDHIVPRSKGGKDEIKNYQTLCNICNIGKSNKDETNLRNRTGAINGNLMSKRKATKHPFL